jgi:signal transduction histidine kinase
MRAALFAIEASAVGLSQHRERLTAVQVDELIEGLVAEICRVRALFEGHTGSPGTFDLGDAIRPVLSCAQSSGLDITFFLPSGIKVAGRPESAAQVMVALLDNVRHHAASSPVDVRVVALDHVVDVFVEDRGTGMPAALRRRVFERGVRSEESAGSGLGLHIARRSMAEQGGSISVRSRRGGGTSVMLRFRRPSS